MRFRDVVENRGGRALQLVDILRVPAWNPCDSLEDHVVEALSGLINAQPFETHEARIANGSGRRNSCVGECGFSSAGFSSAAGST